MRILIVDDAPYMIKVIRDILEAYRHEVYEALNGEDAVIKYAEVNPDVVLMDILMPKLDGISATRKIIERDCSAKIIVITAMGKIGLEKDCLDAGAKMLIVKPFQMRDLLGSIEAIAGHERN